MSRKTEIRGHHSGDDDYRSPLEYHGVSTRKHLLITTDQPPYTYKEDNFTKLCVHL
jgi:hypothetical protein